MHQEFRDLLKNHIGPALKKAGVPFYGVWQAAVFGDRNQYAIIVPISKFADYDGPGPLNSVLEPAEVSSILTRYSKAVQSSEWSASRIRRDMSILTDPEFVPGMAVIVTITVAAGKQMEFEKLWKAELLPALKTADVKEFWGRRITFGGDVNTWVFASMIPNFAELDKTPPLVRALGPEGAAMLVSKFAGVLTSVKYTVGRRVPELSYR